MSFRDIRRAVSNLYHETVKESYDSARASSYFKEIVVSLCLVGAGFGGYWGYRYYKNHKDTIAPTAFSECMALYNEAAQGHPDVWPHVEMKCTHDYASLKNSSFAPFILAIKADALAQQRKFDQAKEALEEVITLMPKNSPLTGLYQTKLALIKMDMADEAMQKSGLEQLQLLANDKNNQSIDAAQYYLGLYYWVHDDIEKAVSIWRELVVTQSSERLASSTWATLAQEKLTQRAQQVVAQPIVAPKK